jgi:multidrug resistance efflux pump
MEPLPPIPSPPGHWIRLFCDRFLPFLAFGVALVAAVFLWRYQGGGRTFIGMGEGARVMVMAPQAGSLLEMLVPPYAVVRQGDPVAVVRGFDPRGAMDRLRLRLEMTRLEAAPPLSEVRAVDLERIRLDLARIRSELAIARVRLEFATREVNRLEPLFRDRLISETTIEVSRGNRDMNAAEVREKERLMDEVEARLRELEERRALAEGMATGAALFPGLAAGTTGAGAGIEEESMNDVVTTLVAPMDGTVGAWLRRPGEFLVEGEPVMTIQAHRAERIVGYMRQPIGFDPKAGMAVQIVRRTSLRERFSSVIQHVGSQFEPITNALALVRDGALMDVGLPVVIDLPADQAVRPGEMVDVLVRVPWGARAAAVAGTSEEAREP